MVARKREAEWKETSDSWETAPTNSVVGWDVPADDPCRGDWQASDSKLLTTIHAVSCGWPSVEGGIEVSVEVRSNVGDLAEEHTACRCSCIRTDLSFQPDQPFILQLRRYFRWKLRLSLSPSLNSLVRRLRRVCFLLL
jgi:hypothetical protein